jgi:hypothetical protein
MPYLIAAIDQIARELKRDVLLVRFDIPGFFPPDNFEQLESRKAFLKWASGEGIRAIPCGPPSNSGWVCGYFGDLYVDVISDDDNPDYQKLRAHLENEDGSMRQPGSRSG